MTATKHFTTDINNLNLDSISYQGTDQVSIGDGSSMPIQHRGSAQLHTSSYKSLLSQLLYVPSITKNLLFVGQFCQDNSVYFKFYSTCLLVKDSHTHEILLWGIVRDGLYVLPAATTTSSLTMVSPQALLSVRASCDSQHLRLGYPSPRMKKFIIQHFHLPVHSNTSVQPCTACFKAKIHALPHSPSPSRSAYAFNLLFLDIWGSVLVLSSTSCQYYLSIVDDHTKFIWFFLLNSKSDVSFFIAFLRCE